MMKNLSVYVFVAPFFCSFIFLFFKLIWIRREIDREWMSSFHSFKNNWSDKCFEWSTNGFCSARIFEIHQKSHTNKKAATKYFKFSIGQKEGMKEPNNNKKGRTENEILKYIFSNG